MNDSIPWTEKYRPTKMEDIVLDNNIRQLIKIFLENRSDLHLLITGNPGIGKTTTIKCIVKKLFQDNKSGYIEINATEDKYIKNVASVITAFCKRICFSESNKMIVFDEADNLTLKCQNDINLMIKEHGKNVKFIFICNDSSKISEDIQSVCRIIRFRKLANESVSKYLEKICKNENIPFNNQGLDTICYIADGDMRKAINDLQKTAYTYGKISRKLVLEICNIPDPKEIKSIIKNCINGDLVNADNELDVLIKKGYYFIDIVNGFYNVIEKDSELDEELKLNLIDIVYQTKIIISKGIRSKLQVSAMICSLTKYVNNL